MNINWMRVGQSKETIIQLLESFLKDPLSSQVEALLLPFGRHIPCEPLVNALVKSNKYLANLKALYIGDMHDYEYKTSDVTLSNISPVLEAYPHLELLQVRGFGREDKGGLSFYKIRHENLKTLIVETGYMLSHKLINQICALELPSLEYLELWLGNDLDYPVLQIGEEEESYSIDNSAFNHLSPIISGKVFPQIKYLGLRSCNYSDVVAQAIVNSPLINSLKVLDLSMGTLTGKGAKAIQNCIEINQLNCQLIIKPQANSEEDRYYALTE